MFHTVRRWIPLVLVVLLLGAVALVMTARPSLTDARSDVATQWRTLAPDLDPRYERLVAANAAAKAVGGPPRAVTEELDAALNRWVELRSRSDASIASQVRAANGLEALGRRLEANVADSPRLRDNAEVNRTLDAFTATKAPASAAEFNAAVAEYQAERNGFLRGPMTEIFRYEEIPALDVETGSLAQT